MLLLRSSNKKNWVNIMAYSNQKGYSTDHPSQQKVMDDLILQAMFTDHCIRQYLNRHISVT